MPREISDSVVVITGASSGIGRATAESFARQQATVVLASRREEALEQVAGECQRLGARTLVVPTDVTDEVAVRQLARRVVEEFGRLDVWVNNAAVTLFGRLEECPSDEYRKVIETNLLGYVHGARAALPAFREQGSGVLINVSSVVASAAQPYTSAYCITKAGVRSLSDCLRMELSLDDHHDIHVCTVLPASIDTPFFQHAANHTGRAIKALDPVYPPEQVAEAIVKLAERPKREVIVGNAGRLMHAGSVLMPGMFEKQNARVVDRNHLQQRPAGPSCGNLFEPSSEGSRRTGGWQLFSAQQQNGTGSFATAGIALGAAALMYAAWRWREAKPAVLS